MNILLVTSPIPPEHTTLHWDKTPPLGLGYLLELLRHDGHTVFFKDLYLNPSLANDLELFLIVHSIDFFGISMNSVCYAGGMIILDKVHHLREGNKWNGKIIVGGPHPSVFPETIPAYVDYICKGEGEHTICAIAQGKTQPRLIEGERVENMDTLPYIPYYEFIKLPYHTSCVWLNKKMILRLITSRGCPFLCQFCSVALGSYWGNRYRYQSAERVFDEMQRLKIDFGAQGIYFRDDNFTLNTDRVIKLCDLLITHKSKLPWICSTRVDNLDYKLIQHMGRAGCRGLFLGTESGSQRLLDYMKKNITLEQIENVVRWATKAQIRCHLSFMMGLPTETENERYQTLIFMEQLKAHSKDISIFKAVPFSTFYFHFIKNDNYSLITNSGIVYQNNYDYLKDRFVGITKANRDMAGSNDYSQQLLPLLNKKCNQYMPRESNATQTVNVSTIHSDIHIDSYNRKERAAIHYYLGRAQLKSQRFAKARLHFFKSVLNYFKLKYAIFACFTFLPARIYPLCAKIVNRNRIF